MSLLKDLGRIGLVIFVWLSTFSNLENKLSINYNLNEECLRNSFQILFTFLPLPSPPPTPTKRKKKSKTQTNFHHPELLLSIVKPRFLRKSSKFSGVLPLHSLNPQWEAPHCPKPHRCSGSKRWCPSHSKSISITDATPYQHLAPI